MHLIIYLKISILSVGQTDQTFVQCHILFKQNYFNFPVIIIKGSYLSSPSREGVPGLGTTLEKIPHI